MTQCITHKSTILFENRNASDMSFQPTAQNCPRCLQERSNTICQHAFPRTAHTQPAADSSNVEVTDMELPLSVSREADETLQIATEDCDSGADSDSELDSNSVSSADTGDMTDDTEVDDDQRYNDDSDDSDNDAVTHSQRSTT
jgi:hypothetical protein